MSAPLLRALAGETLTRPPIWFMRQAGRYLPEYREVRATAPDFIAFCLNPEKAAEVTLQPLRRFAFDAAIVFADILLIPKALGQAVWFETGEGPRLGPLPELSVLEAGIEGTPKALSAVGETLSRVKPQLASNKSLIGFAGAPWTVATYMIGGKGGDRSVAQSMAYQEPEKVDRLLDILVEATARYLAMQAASGADVLKLFESWAEGLPEDLFERLVIGPHRKLVERVRALGVDQPIIGFPRGAGALVEGYAHRVPVQATALDTAQAWSLGKRLQARGMVIQGALDPLLIRAGGRLLDERVDQLLAQWGGGPYIFNLGHGILPDTPIAHVEQVVKRVTGG
jgi:uroporphyrinogen decarboxylase